MEASTSLNSNDAAALVVVARFPFEGKNNDELSFAMGDVITVTQKLEDGGWWEGTHTGTGFTGWFPNSFVTPVDKGVVSPTGQNGSLASPVGNATPGLVDSTAFRSEVMKSWESAELEHVGELKKTTDTFLAPMRKDEPISSKELDTLALNMAEIADAHGELLHRLQLTATAESSAQRVGGAMLASAAKLRNLLLAHAQNHPDAVELLNTRRNELEEWCKRNDEELHHLVTGLSRPFRHLAKYPAFLQELARGLPDGHVDRGDTQRAIQFFKQLAEECEATRRQREAQLDLLSSGQLQDWVGDENLDAEENRLIRVGTATAVVGDQTSIDGLLVLLARNLILLEADASLAGYTVREKLKFDKGMIAERIAPILAPETGQQLETIRLTKDSASTLWLLHWPTKSDSDAWLSAFQRCPDLEVRDNRPSGVSLSASLDEATAAALLSGGTGPVRMMDMSDVYPPARHAQQSMAPTPPSVRARLADQSALKFNHELEMILPEGGNNSSSVVSASSANFSIRPLFPHRSNASSRHSAGAIRLRKAQGDEEQDDASLLRLVDCYWEAAARTYGRTALPPLANLKTGARPIGASTAAQIASISSLSQAQQPQLIVAENERLLVEEMVDGQLVMQEKSLVDTVYALKDEVNTMRATLSTLARDLRAEQKARRRLEDSLQQGRDREKSENNLAAEKSQGGASTPTSL